MTTYGTIPTSSEGGTTTANFEYLSRAKERIQTGLGTQRSWKQMFNLGSLNFPHDISESFPRIKSNISYFSMNYAIIALFILLLCLLWHPFSLIMYIVLMAGWLFLYFLRDEPLVIFSWTVDDQVTLIVLSVVTIGLLLLTDATMNVVLAVLVGVVVVVVHGVLRKTEDLCENDDDVA